MKTQNNNTVDVAVEELETRTEMQMVGFGANPSLMPDGSYVIVYDETGRFVAIV